MAITSPQFCTRHNNYQGNLFLHILCEPMADYSQIQAHNADGFTIYCDH